MGWWGGALTAAQAFVSTSLSLGDKPVATHFHQITVDLRMHEADRVGIDLLKNPKSDALPSDLEGLQQSIVKLQGMVEHVLGYVEGVCDGQVKPNKEIGRFLMDTMAVVPRLGAEQFGSLFNDSVQDVLLVRVGRVCFWGVGGEGAAEGVWDVLLVGGV